MVVYLICFRNFGLRIVENPGFCDRLVAGGWRELSKGHGTMRYHHF
jgi:hypothetical protein